jgi:hypothetical protein
MSADFSTGSSSLNNTSIRLCTEKLNETNFIEWRSDITNALAYMNLEEFLKAPTDALRNRSDYEQRRKQVTTFIRLHLGRKDSSRFVDDLDVYDPQVLWESILNYHAAKSVENAANVMEKLHDIVFVEGDMRKSINTFCATF